MKLHLYPEEVWRRKNRAHAKSLNNWRKIRLWTKSCIKATLNPHHCSTQGAHLLTLANTHQTPTSSLSFPTATQRSTEHGPLLNPPALQPAQEGNPGDIPSLALDLSAQCWNTQSSTDTQQWDLLPKVHLLHLGLLTVCLLLPSHASDATQRTKAKAPMSKAKPNPCSSANMPKPMLALCQTMSFCLLWQLNHFPMWPQLRKP